MKSTLNPAFKQCLIAALLGAIFSPSAHATDYFWTSGDFVPGTTAPSPLVAPDTLTINTGGTKTFNGVNWTNQSTVTWNADGIHFVASNIANDGLWDAKSDDGFTNAGNVSNFYNNATGIFRKSGGTGITSLGANIAFINSGTIDAQTGTIEFAGALNAFNNGTQFTGAGVNKLSNNATFTDSFTSQNLVLAGGTYTGAGASAGAVMNGSVSWTGGSFAGTWQIASGQTLNANDGTDNKYFYGTTFTNYGNINWQSTQAMRFTSSNLVNNGVVDMQTDAGLVNSGNVSNFYNNATGIFRKSSGAGVTTIAANVIFINSGIIDAQTGTIDFAGAGNYFNDGTRFTGAGINRISNSATFTDSFTSQNLVLAGGTYTGAGASAGAVMNGSVNWTGGSFNGTWQIAAGQTLNGMDGSDNKYFSGTTFTNNGNINWQSTQAMRFTSSNLVNNGVVDMQTDAALANSGNVSNFYNNATGIFRKSGGTGTTSLGANIAFINSGTIDAQTGTIEFTGASNYFNDGTRFIGAGVNKVSNNATFTDSFTSQNLVLAGGTYTGAGATAGAVLHGNVSWTGGHFGGTWQIASGQTLNANDGTDDKYFWGTNFTNNGNINWQSTQAMRFTASNLTNNGVVDMQTDAGLVNSGNVSNFINNGTLLKSGGTGTSAIGLNINFVNNGTVQVDTGTIQLPSNFVNPGTITGSGAIQTNLLTNNGHVAPGTGVGTLTINGNYAQGSAGILDIQLGSLTNFDLLNITGTASLDGALALSCFGNCSFAAGDEFVILDSVGSLTGTFAGGVTLNGFASGAFNVVYDTNLDEVRLHVLQDVTAVPEPENWAMLLAGLGLVGLASRKRKYQLSLS